MIWAAQKRRVEQLSLLASRESDDVTYHRHALHEWRSKTFGTLDALAWSFTAGAVWSAIPAGDGRKSRARRFVLGAANLLLLARRHQ